MQWDTPLPEQTSPRNICQKRVKQIKFAEMLPVEVFPGNTCHDDSLFLSVPREQYLTTHKSQGQNPACEAALRPTMLTGAGVVRGRSVKTRRALPQGVSSVLANYSLEGSNSTNTHQAPTAHKASWEAARHSSKQTPPSESSGPGFVF